MTSPNLILTVSRLWKSYSAIALADAHFDLVPGEVHAVVGENGAGKSTLARIVAGVIRPDAGELRLNGQLFMPESRAAAERCGVRLVMQELNLIGNLTVAESIFIDRLPHRFGWIDYGQLNREARQVMALVGLEELDPARLINSLGIGQQQLVEIAAGLSRRCQVLILDEPTAALTDPEIKQLFAQVAKLKNSNVAIIYITHRLEEIRRIADRITVLRDGKNVGTHNAREIERTELVRLMVGRELVPRKPCSRPQPAGVVGLRVVGLCRRQTVRDVSFEARYGEILGFAGLMGSGRTETMRAVVGADRPDAGQVFLHGASTPARIRGPHEAVQQGMALLTEDRKEEGLLLPLPVRMNITLTDLRSVSRFGGWISRAAERAVADRWTQKLSVRCDTIDQRVSELSGGNQQKVVIAKWLHRDCRILIFDEPTRGIDVGAKFEIYQLLDELAAHGKAIIVVSSDLEELMALCDRIVVMSAGHVAARFNRGEWNQNNIMAAALSGYA
ncbi:MAG: sugar ABC transporter ATP-binding protein [Limisphaerales bacterium]